MFKLFVEHELVDGKVVVEEFEGVESFNNPPMSNKLQLSFSDDDRDEKILDYGTVVRGEVNE